MNPIILSTKPALNYLHNPSEDPRRSKQWEYEHIHNRKGNATIRPKDGLITKFMALSVQTLVRLLCSKLQLLKLSIGLHWIIWRHAFVGCYKLRK